VGVLHIGKDLKHEDNINWPRKQHLQTSLKAGFRAIGRRRQHQIEALSRELAELELKAETVQKSESRLEPLIEEHMVRLDPDKKRLMDHFRVIGRNVFYAALGPFKKAYNNYRDDHDQFRQLTQCSGVLEVAAEQIVVHLMPRGSTTLHECGESSPSCWQNSMAVVLTAARNRP
jgi:hypothetical protein